MTLCELLQDNEVLLTNLKINNNSNKDRQLRLSFMGLSDVYVPHLHTYSSTTLTEKQEEQLIDILNKPEIDGAKNPFYDYRSSITRCDEYFNIVQIRAPVSKSEDFKRLKYIKKKEEIKLDSNSGKVLFPGTFFSKHARWNIGYGGDSLQPGFIYSVNDTRFIKALKQKRALDDINRELKRELNKISSSFNLDEQNRFKGSFLSKLREFIINPNLDSFNKKSVFSRYYTGGLKEIVEELKKQESSFIEEYSDLCELNYRKKRYELFLNKRPNFKMSRQISGQELLGAKYLMLDIETPKFMDGNYEVTQVSCCLVERGEIRKLRVYNKEKVNFNEIKNHEVLSGYKNDADLIDDLSSWISSENIDVVMAYNNGFDLAKLRERGDFETNSDDAPKMNSNMKFFERFVFQNSFCLDLFRIAQIVLKGHPNSKLEMFSRFLNGDKGYEKKISYLEMSEIQKLSEGKKVDLSISTKGKLRSYYDSIKTSTGSISAEEIASRLILDYVCSDTTTMHEIYFHPFVQSCVSNIVDVSSNFQLDFMRVLSSSNSLIEVYDRGYFKHIGINRDMIYRRGIKALEKECIKNEKALKDYIVELFKAGNSSGVFHNVSRRFIPTSMLLRDYGSKTTKSIENFLGNTHKKLISEGSNPNEMIYLLSYADGLLKYLFNDIGSLIRKRDGYEDLANKLSNNSSGDISLIDFFARTMLNTVVEKGFFGEGSNIKYSLDSVASLKKSHVFQEEILKLLEDVESIAHKNYLTDNDLYNIFWEHLSLKKQSSRVRGHYRMPPWSLVRMIENEVRCEKEKLLNNNEIVAIHFPWIYTIPKRGTKFISEENLPGFDYTLRVINDTSFFPVDAVISTAYISKNKVHSKEHGFYKGLKVKKDPSFLSTPFLSEVFENAFNSITSGNTNEGFNVILRARDELLEIVNNRTKPNKERFLSYNKTKKCYIGYQDSRKYYFSLPGIYEPEDYENGVGYVILPKNVDEKSNAQKSKIFIHSIEEYNQDYRMVFEEFRKKALKFIDGSIKSSINSNNPQLIEKAHNLAKTLNQKIKPKDERQLELF